MAETLQHTLPRRRVKPKKPPKQMPWVIPEMCEGCADCVNRCSQQGLVMVETNISGVYVPWLLEPEYCTGCGKCAEGCVMGAIVMTAYVDMALERFRNQRPVIAVG